MASLPEAEGTPMTGLAEAEGTPMTGPLPLELAQIQADTQREAAALAARRRSEDLRPGGDICIKIRRSSTGDTIHVVNDDIATRRSSRPIKRRKFDDEVGEGGSGVGAVAGTGVVPGVLTPLPLTPVAPPPVPDSSRSRNSSSCESPNVGLDLALVNSCQALPDLKMKKKKKKGRRDGTYKDLGRWKASDDLALITAVQQTRDLGSVFKGVKFSCHFTLSEIQERWYALLYDPVISKLAMEAVRNLPQEIVHKVTKDTPFSREEEDALANSGLKSSAANLDVSHFSSLLSRQPSVFHPSRTGRSLMTHWQYMKQYSLLPDMTVQPLPRPDTAQHILNFHDGEDQVVDSELLEPPDLRLNTEMMMVDRMAKREIRRLEAEVSKWQIVVEQVTGQPTADFDNQTLAVLRGRLVRYLMRSREITVGRATPQHTVDVDLTLEGPATKVSRKQAIIKLSNSGDFHIANEGRRPVMVNGKAVIMGEAAKLANNTVVEFCNLRFVFLINTELIEAIRTEAAKNQFVARSNSDVVKHNRLVVSMDEKDGVSASDGCEVEEGPLEETLESPRFYNLTVEETQDLQVSSYNDRSRIVFSPGGDEGYLVTGSDDARSLATDSTPRSNVSTVSVTGRRYLEWDYGSDLGPQYQTQGEAALSLSQLEKLAISNYSEFLSDDKSKDSTKETVVGAAGPRESDYVAEKFSKFADSLMRQRQLQQQNRSSVIKTRAVDGQVRPISVSSPVKSSSLGSLSDCQPPLQARSRASSSLSLTAAPPVLMSGPSSSSSAGTIVARQDMRQVAGLEEVMARLDFLDPELQPQEVEEVSTVSTLEDISAQSSSLVTSLPSDRPQSKVVWDQNLSPAPAPISNFRTFPSEPPVLEKPSRYLQRVRQSSEPSSVPTTSDEEMDRQQAQTDTSTMESAQIEGKAKSFEYIPGETYNMQENSSSYEYLPGHLITDNRPPTVLRTRPDTPPHPDQITASLDLVSAELREKSKDLMAKNISQTKHFFKKLKSYITFLSTPSLTVEDSRVKQELADRIMSLLSNEETRLGMSSGLTSRELSLTLDTLDNGTSKKSVETSTRQLPWSGESKHSQTKRSSDSEVTSLSSLSSELKESDNSSRLSRMSDWRQNTTKSELEYQLKQGQMDSTQAVEIVQKLQRKRLEHMKKLKKEMKKLEKIDGLIVGAAVGKKVPEVSDLSVASSVSSVKSSVISISIEGETSQKFRATKTVTNTNMVKVQSDRTEREPMKAVDNKENTPTASNFVFEHISPILTRSPAKVRSSKNFSQVYPSDTNTLTDSNVDTLNSNGTFITKKSPRQKKRSPKKTKSPRKTRAVAYYLPCDNMSPIRLGTRVLREQNGWTGQSNRNVISSYMAAIDTQPIARRKSQSSSNTSEQTARGEGEVTLQQALARRRGDFVRNCERRVEALRMAKEAREVRTAKQEAWLEELGRLSPTSQRRAEPCFSPVPVKRLFNHREMVRSTREKYLELPEVQYAKLDAKRNVRYRGNRLMARIYSGRLQRKVVGRRQVSFTVHQLVV